MWARLIAAALGGWLIASPAVLGYSGAAESNAQAVGPIVVGASLIAVWQVMRPLRWVEAVVGSWLLVAPWILVKWYEALPTANSLAVGLALAGLAFLGGRQPGTSAADGFRYSRFSNRKFASNHEGTIFASRSLASRLLAPRSYGGPACPMTRLTLL